MPADEQLPAFQRVKAALQGQGGEFTEDGTLADGTRGKLAAHHPETGHTVSLTTTQTLAQIAVFLSGPFVMPAAGENPLKG